ncbi:tonoplast intrinsic protein 5;1 [Wolffia australiana]
MESNPRGPFRRLVAPSALRAYLAEFISTFLFVFATVGSAMSARKAAPWDASPLLATALAQALSLFAAVYIAAGSSGGHVNPAVTFAVAVAGHVTPPTAVLYWASQLTGSTLACLLLRAATAGQAVPTTGIAQEMTGFGAAIIEGVITFALVFTVLVAMDPRPKAAVVGPMAVGMVAGSGVLAAGSFTGGSMNPARSFGPAVVTGNFKNQGVYWAGPLLGSTIAALLHHHVLFPTAPQAPGVEETPPHPF